jgi:hypothetical protein
MHQIILKPRAVLMIKDAYDWYEERSKGLGEIFLDELDKCYKKLQSNPAGSPKIIKLSAGAVEKISIPGIIRNNQDRYSCIIRVPHQKKPKKQVKIINRSLSVLDLRKNSMINVHFNVHLNVQSEILCKPLP